MVDESKKPRAKAEVAFETVVAKPAAAPAPAPVVPSSPRKTPAAWAAELGHISKADPRLPQSVAHADLQHSAADQLYGWSRHAYNFQAEPFEISREDYETALKAALQFPAAAPHAAALPPSERDRFKGFTPCATRARDQEKR